jgi:uncharacterized protein (TIGR03382 family)
VVAKDPGRPHLVKTCAIRMSYGTEAAPVRGNLSWQPSGHLATDLTYGGAAAAVLLALGLGLLARRRRAGR